MGYNFLTMLRKRKLIKLKRLGLVASVLLVLAAGFFGWKRLNSEDKYTAFLLEVYDTIDANYWNEKIDGDLLTYFKVGTEKLSSQIVIQSPLNRKGLQKMLAKVIGSIKDEGKKKEFAVTMADAVLAALPPAGRSRLYSQKQEVTLKNEVNNVNPDADLYQNLGVAKGASQEAVTRAYQEKVKSLEKQNTSEAKNQLAQVNKAYQTLSDTASRQKYDQAGVQTTLESKLLRPNIFYLHLVRFSPTTMDDLVRVTSKVDQGSVLDTLIFDLRDNIGGAIDGLPYFLGPFIGNDTYAYQFYHRGEKTDYKTKTGWLNSLVRYKKVVILVNNQTQSSAEVMASVLKKYNVGVLVGTKTRGWGTVEKVFEIKNQLDKSEKYSIFLVHSLTLREDGNPIEGKGVDPEIDITNKNWPYQLYARFNSWEIVNGVKEVL